MKGQGRYTPRSSCPRGFTSDLQEAKGAGQWLQGSQTFRSAAGFTSDLQEAKGAGQWLQGSQTFRSAAGGRQVRRAGRQIVWDFGISAVSIKLSPRDDLSVRSQLGILPHPWCQKPMRQASWARAKPSRPANFQG